MTSSPERMHAVTDETRQIVDLVLDYSRQRLLAEDVPLAMGQHFVLSI